MVSSGRALAKRPRKLLARLVIGRRSTIIAMGKARRAEQWIKVSAELPRPTMTGRVDTADRSGGASLDLNIYETVRPAGKILIAHREDS
jgi:hypothetical protein